LRQERIFTVDLSKCEYTEGKVKQAPARARDFYDIHGAITKLGIDLARDNNLELARHIFAAKQVPLRADPRTTTHSESYLDHHHGFGRAW
jgi:hypothetical protein